MQNIQSHQHIVFNSKEDLNIWFKQYPDLKQQALVEVYNYAPYMTIYERAHIIGYRAEQLAHDADPYIEIDTVTNQVYDEVLVATQELDQGHLNQYWIARRMPGQLILCCQVGDLKRKRNY